MRLQIILFTVCVVFAKAEDAPTATQTPTTNEAANPTPTTDATKEKAASKEDPVVPVATVCKNSEVSQSLDKTQVGSDCTGTFCKRGTVVASQNKALINTPCTSTVCVNQIVTDSWNVTLIGTDCVPELTAEEKEYQKRIMYALIGSFLGAIALGSIITSIICLVQKKNQKMHQYKVGSKQARDEESLKDQNNTVPNSLKVVTKPVETASEQKAILNLQQSSDNHSKQAHDEQSMYATKKISASETVVQPFSSKAEFDEQRNEKANSTFLNVTQADSQVKLQLNSSEAQDQDRRNTNAAAAITSEVELVEKNKE